LIDQRAKDAPLLESATMPSRPETPRRPRGGKIKHAAHVLSVLRRIGRPASAYEIQALLAAKEHLAPPTIYRALDHLIETGSVHKLESLNAFVACSHASHDEPAVFAICDGCGSVTEFSEPRMKSAIDAWSRGSDFAVEDTTLELHGSCHDCRTKS
jgi:Fur family zinc uptake transcriptional regulator